MANELRCVLIGGILIAAGHTALAEEPVSTDAIYACAVIDDNTARLDCYDSAVGRLQAAEEAGEITTITREEVEQAERDSFGFSFPSLPSLALPSFGGGDREEIETITAGVVGIDEDVRGRLLVTLDNGAVWRQTDDTRITSFYRRAETAEIKKGALSSFWMTLGDSRRFRAERVS